MTLMKEQPFMDESGIQRFFSKVDMTDDCWLWQASLDKHGYGQVNIGRKIYRSHRVSYSLIKGDIPKGLDLDHLCRVRSCVNPDHLEAVTRSVNLKRGMMHNKLKTACPSGHEYDVVDLYGRRRCSVCDRLNAHRNYLKRKQVTC